MSARFSACSFANLGITAQDDQKSSRCTPSAAAVGPERRWNVTKRPIVLVQFSPCGRLFQFAMQLGDALAATGEKVELLTGPEPELAATQPGFTVRPVLPTW